MSVNHAISDLVSIIRNGYLARKSMVSSPLSRVRENVLKILKEEGYILGYSKSSSTTLSISLKYHLSNPVLSDISVVSTPGRRVYCNVDNIPMVKNGLGVVVMSTCKGIVSDSFARTNRVGGEVLLKVF